MKHSNITVRVEFLPGTTIFDAIKEAKLKAIEWDVAYVKFDFNEASISVGQYCNVFKAHNEWQEKKGDRDFFVFNKYNS